MKKTKAKKDLWVDVNNDDVMREMGFLRPFPVTPRESWKKTPAERRALRKYRHMFKGDGHFHNIPSKFTKVRSKLIINLYKNKKFSKTTYSIECWQDDIPQILSEFQMENRKTGVSTSLVRKYSWNGKTYDPRTLPFRG